MIKYKKHELLFNKYIYINYISAMYIYIHTIIHKVFTYIHIQLGLKLTYVHM